MSAAIRYSLNDLGRVFGYTLPPDITPADVISQSIVFYKPDGTRFEKAATRVIDVVTYDNSLPDESILDLIGPWEYAAKVVLTGADADTLEVPERIIFWVA